MPTDSASGGAGLERLYFAYASNMDPRQMRARCPGASPYGRARLERWSFRIGHRGVATVIPATDDMVWGALWWVSEHHLDALDGFEGVALGRYRREVVSVVGDSGPVEAAVYIEPFTESAPAREGYAERILHGAEFFGLPEEYQALLQVEVGRP